VRTRRLASLTAAVAVLGGLALTQPANAGVRVDAYGHIIIKSDPITGLPAFTTTDTYLASWDCEFEQGALGTEMVVVLCTPKATLPTGTTWFCTEWVTTATASPGVPTNAGTPTGEVRGTSQCKDAGGDAVTKLVTSGGSNTTDTKVTFPDLNVDVWAVRCYASGTGINGRPSPGFYVDCYEPSAHLVEVR
jgi:hypothetical protein